MIELLVVLAGLALLTGIAVPWFAGVADSVRFRTAARALAGELRDARGVALRTGQPVVLAFDPAGRSYGIAGTQRWVALPDDLALRWRGAADPTRLGFFPDGTTTGGELWIAGPRRSSGIAIDPLTGRFAALAGSPPP